MNAQISGERRLLACTLRQLAGRNHDHFPRMALPKMFAASWRKLQAGSLCSPEL